MVENYTGRKIKVLQIDNVGDTRINSYDLIRTSIGIHFRIEKHGVAKKMNHSLLEKI